MAEYLNDKRLSLAGKVVGSVAFMAGGAEVVFAGAEFVAQQPVDGVLMMALGAMSLGLGWAFWGKSAERMKPQADPGENEPLYPGYLYTWVEEVGWVPLQPYNPGGSETPSESDPNS